MNTRRVWDAVRARRERNACSARLTTPSFLPLPSARELSLSLE